ncbi:cytochrome P450 [Solimonas terrae]|uniref:Cytochrome P450 n=1 Tax=Solimonas terrae TaxID=1396819 RepID=A0A6M2BNC7_9GAMM|nr:cytochrome P450 [Solimonas terrae]NGY03958.1 cytochrome P450 [Solimonas terrae]
MSSSTVQWDPYNADLVPNPYPTYKRLRDEAPLYYNEEYDFYALTRYADVEHGLRDKENMSSHYGDILEFIKAKSRMPDAVFIHQDPPIHSAYRSLMQRIITPKRMLGIEQEIRKLCARSLDPLVGKDYFDMIGNLGAEVPMRAISMLLGIPEEDQTAIRESVDARMRTEAGKPIDFAKQQDLQAEALGNFEEYIKWREKNPSDDMMTELLTADFKDPSGTTRKLTRDEISAIVNVVAGAGNETTNRLIGWMGKTLAEHPDQRRQIAQNPGLIPQAIEELLRFEPPGPFMARYVTNDIEYYGRKIPKGSALMLMVSAANRDERRFANGDSFDINREQRPHMTFGNGIHVCIGAPLARLEGRVVMEELLKRFPEWEVDYENAVLSSTSTVRGWDSLPVWVGSKPKGAVAPKRAAAPEPEVASGPVPLEGKWNVVVKGPTGPQPAVLTLARSGDSFTGEQTGDGSTSQIQDFSYDGKQIYWVNRITKPMKLKVEFKGEINGNVITGKAKAGFMGSYPFTATKA